VNKISYLRKRVLEQYHNNELKGAADSGEALLREHWNNQAVYTLSYAKDVFNLARIYDKLGQLERAAELYADSARRITYQEGESLTFAACLSNLSIVLGQLGFSEPALYMCIQVATIRQNILSEEGPDMADSLYNLANAAADMGRVSEALRWHSEALRIRETLGATEDIIHSLHSLAFLYEESEEYEKAVSCAETAMRLSKDEARVSACHYLAGLYESWEKNDKALPLYQQALEATAEYAGREHSAYLNIATKLASLMAQENQPRESLKLLNEVREIFYELSGINHMFYANCLRNMAILHKQLNEPDEAESLILRSMKIRQNNSEDIIDDVLFLIKLHLHQGGLDKAIEVLIYALMHSDADDPDFTEMLNNLSDAFTQDDGSPISEVLQSLESITSRDKLWIILNKWSKWDEEPIS